MFLTLWNGKKDMSTTPTASAQAGQCPFSHGRDNDYFGYEPFDMADPFPAYAQLREQAPIMFDERTGYWVVSRFDDVKAVFNDWETFSSENAQAPVRKRGPEATKIMKEGGFTAYSGLSARIPPEHTRIRQIAQKAFTPRRFKELEPDIRAGVVERLQAMKDSSDVTGDILRDLAYDIPTITILSFIGVDTGEIDTYKKWSDSRAAMTWGNLSDEEQIPHAHNLVDYWQECLRLVEAAHNDPGPNFVGDLVRHQQEGGEISDHEIASLLYSLLFAGHETTTTLISNIFRVLLTQRDQWQAVIDNPKLASKAVDEVLRMSGSIVAWRRKATKDAVVAGQNIKEGDELILLMGSANRDEAHFDDPDTFDINRSNARDHLSFGYGIHYCLGNKLAQLQGKICLEEVVKLIPSLRLADDADIDFRENISFRVPTSVPVTWDN